MRRLFVAVLALTSVVAIVSSLRTPDAAVSVPAAPVLGTPLWSARRVPQPIIDEVGAAHLQSVLVAQLGSYRGCFEVRDDTGPIATLNRDQPQTPASTLKLLTATAALARLGPEFRFTTTVRAPAAVRNGAVERLIFVGGGDPLLATPERITLDAQDPEQAGFATTPLATLADRIVAAGVRSVPGGVVGTDARYDTTREIATWSPSERASIGPIGALTVNDGGTGASGTGAATTDPALNAATELTRLLAARGVTLGPPRGDPVARATPSDAITIATIESAPLPDVLTEMLSASDNLTAELVIRELGARAGDGTTARGLEEVAAALGALGVDLTGATIVDGSGLSHSNTMTCRALLKVLDLTRRPQFAPIRAGLAIAGERGTLATRLRSTPLAGNLRAKTGTLSGVTGLAGFVAGDRPLRLSLLASGPFGEASSFALREAMATEIARFPQAVGGTALVPIPAEPIRPRACPDGDSAC